MEPIYMDNFTLSDLQCDRFGRLKPSAICWFVQEMASRHCLQLQLDWDTLASRGMFWAIIRHKVQVQRLPKKGEHIRIETWPMPTTRVAYPRNVVAFDEAGQELWRSTSLWVLMDMQSRAMILPGKSGVVVEGILRGGELPSPKSLMPKNLPNETRRKVRFGQLDRNGHMNNTKYLEWVMDLLPGSFHRDHPLKGFAVCYLNEAREADPVSLRYDLDENGQLLVDAVRPDPADETKTQRVFAVRAEFR